MIKNILDAFKNNKGLVFILGFLLIAVISFFYNQSDTESRPPIDTPVTAPTQIEPTEEPAEIDDGFNFDQNENLGNILEHSATEAAMLVFNRGFSIEDTISPHVRLSLMRPYISDDVYLYFETRYENIDWETVRAQKINVFADIVSYEVLESNLSDKIIYKVEILYEGDAKNLINIEEERYFIVELQRTADYHNWTVAKISPTE